MFRPDKSYTRNCIHCLHLKIHYDNKNIRTAQFVLFRRYFCSKSFNCFTVCLAVAIRDVQFSCTKNKRN